MLWVKYVKLIQLIFVFQAKVFGTEKLRGFAMSKHIGAHLLQADGSAQPASKAKPAAKKVVKKAKKEESEEEAADDSEEESPPPKKVAKKMTKKQGNLFMGIDNFSGAVHSVIQVC